MQTIRFSPEGQKGLLLPQANLYSHWDVKPD